MSISYVGKDVLSLPTMNIHAYREMKFQTAGGEENVRVFWRHLFEDDNTYAVQFILSFTEISVDCIYCFTDGFTHTMIINTEPVFRGELYEKIMPAFVNIYHSRNLFD